MTTAISGVLFDLDGTLLNTAPDFVYALNQVRAEFNLAAISFETIAPIANLGSRAMIKRAFNIEEDHEHFELMREKFLNFYAEHIANATHFFPEIDKVLQYLDDNHIPWGIVTNKLTVHTTKVLAALNFSHRPGCVICGDTLTTYKPHPEPILYACKLLGIDPARSLYVGDAPTDVAASKAAGLHSLVALYGYINEGEDPLTWKADGYINHPLEIIDWLLKYPANIAI